MSTNLTVPLPPNYVDTPKNRGVLVHHVREIMAERGHLGKWQVFDIRDGMAFATSGIPSATGGSIKVILDPKFSPARMPELENMVAGKGLTITQLRMDLPPAQRYAVASRITPAVKALRDYLAASLGRHQHEIALNAIWNPEGHVKMVWIKGLPSTMPDEKLEGIIQAFIGRLPGGSPSWEVELDPLNGRAILAYREPEKLPSLVRFREIALAEIDASKQTKLPIGFNSNGEEVILDLKAGPHALVVGETGSGKSVCGRVIITQALARGYELVLVEPTKKAAGLKNFIPYSKGFFLKDVEEAADALDAVYAEVRRRVDLIDDVDGENWKDLPAGSVRPWLVVVDEYTGLITTDKKPMGDPKDPVIQELLEEWLSVTSAAARIQSKVGRIAKEARSAGIHLLILTQRPDASDIPGQVRTNLGSAVQLVAPHKPPTRDAMGMVFPGDGPAEGLEIVKQFNDGRSHGLGVSFVDGGRLQGFRVALIEPGEVVPYLEEIGVPPGIPLLPGRGYGKVKAAQEDTPNSDVAEDDQFPPLDPDAGDFPF